MGWKNLKEHYGIEHLVRVTDAGVCIGSAYVHDLLVVKPDGTVVRPHTGLGDNADLRRYRTEMEADAAKVRELLERPDAFATSITVYTYQMGDIIEKQCEALGWPNVTHDGWMMYENAFSTDRDQVARWAENNAASAARSIRETITSVERDQAERRKRLAEYEAAIQKLDVRLSAEQWLETTLYQGVEVLDPDGWDRSAFEQSWAEPIRRAEFERRLMHSTCRFPTYFLGLAVPGLGWTVEARRP